MFKTFVSHSKKLGHLDTKQQILNAAESLFAREGYQATSMRAITESARVNLAAVNYHFGSKEALFEAIFERRLRPLNEVRQKRLKEIRDEARRQGLKPGAREILRAFIEPALRFKESSKGEVDFTILIGRSFIDPDDTAQKIFFRLMKPVSRVMLEMLSEALPELPREAIFWRYQFVIGALARTMRIYKNPKFESLKVNPETDVDLLIDSLISFAVAGMETPIG
ncbi:MAG TPA: TetR family transcriptional regulator [Thermodesulfovibrionales bacterium]|nr:TetR family transcriptional regulator [Thermodesulfovibrionales bacterium]